MIARFLIMAALLLQPFLIEKGSCGAAVGVESATCCGEQCTCGDQCACSMGAQEEPESEDSALALADRTGWRPAAPAPAQVVGVAEKSYPKLGVSDRREIEETVAAGVRPQARLCVWRT